MPNLPPAFALILLVLSACAANGDPGVGARTDALTSAEYDGADWHPAHPDNYQTGRSGHAIDMVIIHTAQGSYEGTIGWFSNPAAVASTQYVVSSDGDVTQMVAESDSAWHAGNDEYSRRSIGIEHEGFVADADRWYTDEMYGATAALVRYLVDKYDIPVDREHIIGHNEVPHPFDSGRVGGISGHTDPGDGWRWGHFLGLVRAAGAAEEPAVTAEVGTFVAPPAVAAPVDDDDAAVDSADVPLPRGSALSVGRVNGGCSAAGARDGAPIGLLLFLPLFLAARLRIRAAVSLGLILVFSACASSTTSRTDACPDPSGRGCGEPDSATPVLPPDGGDPVPMAPYDCGATTFELTDTQEDLVVPADVQYMHVKAWGAGGNHEGGCEEPDGGVGGFTEAVFAVTPADRLTVIVGHLGRAGTDGGSRYRFGFGAWGGGGLSGVFIGHEEIAEEDFERALVVAGGGGSAAGGCAPGGPGNHPEAGGQSTMHGEFGPSSADVVGGAGGYRGGTAGARDVGASGGSGYVAPHATDSRILYSEVFVPFPPATDDPDYVDGIGQNEHDGLVVVRFVCDRPELI